MLSDLQLTQNDKPVAKLYADEFPPLGAPSPPKRHAGGDRADRGPAAQEQRAPPVAQPAADAFLAGAQDAARRRQAHERAQVVEKGAEPSVRRPLSPLRPADGPAMPGHVRGTRGGRGRGRRKRTASSAAASAEVEDDNETGAKLYN